MEIKYFIRILLALFLLAELAPAQTSNSGNENMCLDAQFENRCYASIKSAYADYVYLKSRSFSYQVNPEANFSILLKKNMSYVFSIYTNFQSKSTNELKLFDEDNKLLVTNKGDKITVQPEKSGKYYITISLGKNRNNCCLVLCGMLNKYTPEETPVKSKK